MAFDELIAARLVVGFHGTEATDGLITALASLHAQNLIVFERNFSSPEQFTRMIQRLEEALGRRLLVMVDHEGGRVIRFKSGVTQFPDALTVGRTQEPASVEHQGAIEAQELRPLGVSMNLAPCVDVLVEGSDPIIGDRSYGSDPRRVSEQATARIRGLQAAGVGACAKHFPGLGAVQRDPHQVLPTIHLGWDAMRSTHLPPFQAAIDAGVAAVMSSHVCYPALGDPAGMPATFSSQLTQDVLRRQLGFRGLALTDDLEMGALRSFGGIGEAAIRATKAGHDLVLICSDLTAAQAALAALRTAYAAGRLSTRELESSLMRLRNVKQKFLAGTP